MKGDFRIRTLTNIIILNKLSKIKINYKINCNFNFAKVIFFDLNCLPLSHFSDHIMVKR